MPLTPDLSGPLRALVAAMAADESGILERLLSQQKDATLFTGPLFKLLEQISAQSGDPQFDLRLADFLKAYSGFQNASGTTQAILDKSEKAEVFHSRPFAKTALATDGKAFGRKRSDHVDSDLAVLKREIIPLPRRICRQNERPRQAARHDFNAAAQHRRSERKLPREPHRQVRPASELLPGQPRPAGYDARHDERRFFSRKYHPEPTKTQDRFLRGLTSLLSQRFGRKGTGWPRPDRTERHLTLDAA